MNPYLSKSHENMTSNSSKNQVIVIFIFAHKSSGLLVKRILDSEYWGYHYLLHVTWKIPLTWEKSSDVHFYGIVFDYSYFWKHL